jgi:hypothetical protein
MGDFIAKAPRNGEIYTYKRFLLENTAELTESCAEELWKLFQIRGNKAKRF